MSKESDKKGEDNTEFRNWEVKNNLNGKWNNLNSKLLINQNITIEYSQIKKLENFLIFWWEYFFANIKIRYQFHFPRRKNQNKTCNIIEHGKEK